MSIQLRPPHREGDLKVPGPPSRSPAGWGLGRTVSLVAPACAARQHGAQREHGAGQLQVAGKGLLGHWGSALGQPGQRPSVWTPEGQ